MDWSGTVERQAFDVGGELVLAGEHLVAGDDLTGVAGHAAHRRDQARFGAALHFVVRAVVADCVD